MEFEDMSLNGKDLEILTTNLKPSFWRNLKTILRQNKKAVLLEFLFGSQKISSTTDADIEKKFKALENNLNSLQERVIHLENQNLENKRNINMLSAADKMVENENKLSLGISLVIRSNDGLRISFHIGKRYNIF